MSYFYKDKRLDGLSQAEARLAVKFMEENEQENYTYDFNVRLKRQLDLPPDFPAEYVEMAENSSALRIDIVIYATKYIYITEIRPAAKHSAIGSLMMYKTLYQIQFVPDKPVLLILITDALDNATQITCRQLLIKYIVYK